MSIEPRSYHSPIRLERAAATHARIVDSARRLFVNQGYTATTIAQIARDAGVSPQTIYNSIGGKGALLLKLIELVDEVAQVLAIQQRIAASEDPYEILRLAAELRARMMEGADDIVAALVGAAYVEPEVARAYDLSQARSRAGTRRVVERLSALGALRDEFDVETAADSLYTLLHHALWFRLVRECGWSPDRFVEWTADMLARTLLRQ